MKLSSNSATKNVFWHQSHICTSIKKNTSISYLLEEATTCTTSHKIAQSTAEFDTLLLLTWIQFKKKSLIPAHLMPFDTKIINITYQKCQDYNMINFNIITTWLSWARNDQDSGTELLFAIQRKCFTRQQSLWKHFWECSL